MKACGVATDGDSAVLDSDGKDDSSENRGASAPLASSSESNISANSASKSLSEKPSKSGSSPGDSDTDESPDPAESSELRRPPSGEDGLNIAIAGTTISGSIMINVVSGPPREDSILSSTPISGDPSPMRQILPKSKNK